MLTLDAGAVAEALPYDQLIDALRDAFRAEVDVPLRAHHEVPVPGGNAGTLRLMPAWRRGRSMTLAL